jgi:hypothetical protein
MGFFTGLITGLFTTGITWGLRLVTVTASAFVLTLVLPTTLAKFKVGMTFSFGESWCILMTFTILAGYIPKLVSNTNTNKGT